MNVQRSLAEGISSVRLLKAQPEGMKPPVRWLAVRSYIAVGSLHDVIQVAFGRQDAHRRTFEDLSGDRYAPPGGFGVPSVDEDRAALPDVLSRADEVLGVLAHAVKQVDGTLAKRLRKAAFKAGSAK
ncbi:hypothetical protein ACH4YO_41530 [Streptomyces noursei]|uniref:hypothetical protein n=1 Tax=Streptomyces noursei TaxID=1971 RepID=UPI0033C59F47